MVSRGNSYRFRVVRVLLAYIYKEEPFGFTSSLVLLSGAFTFGALVSPWKASVLYIEKEPNSCIYFLPGNIV